MEFIYQYPETNGTDTDLLDAGPITDVAIATEAAGWGGICFTEHPIPAAKWLELGGHQSLDPFVALSAAGAVTERIKLLTYLSVMPYRNPLLLAKTAASVDKVSNGRFILGLGTGYHKPEFRALGVDFDERNLLFDEALDVMPLHWKGEPFSYEGIHFSAKDVIARPKPVQDPIPIWIGGNAKITLRRVATKAQGWMPLIGPAESFPTTRTPVLESMDQVKPKIDGLLQQAGDRASNISIAFPYVDMSILRPTENVEAHREAFGQLAEFGVTHVMIYGRQKSLTETTDYLASFGEMYI